MLRNNVVCSLKLSEIRGAPPLQASYGQVNVLLSDCGIVMRIINLVFLWCIMHFVYETVIYLKSSQTVAWSLFLLSIFCVYMCI